MTLGSKHDDDGDGGAPGGGGRQGATPADASAPRGPSSEWLQLSYPPPPPPPRRAAPNQRGDGADADAGAGEAEPRPTTTDDAAAPASEAAAATRGGAALAASGAAADKADDDRATVLNDDPALRLDGIATIAVRRSCFPRRVRNASQPEGGSVYCLASCGGAAWCVHSALPRCSPRLSPRTRVLLVTTAKRRAVCVPPGVFCCHALGWLRRIDGPLVVL